MHTIVSQLLHLVRNERVAIPDSSIDLILGFAVFILPLVPLSSWPISPSLPRAPSFARSESVFVVLVVLVAVAPALPFNFSCNAWDV